MKFFIDTADLADIGSRRHRPLDGVTTNPPLVAKAGQISSSWSEICRSSPDRSAPKSPRRFGDDARRGPQLAKIAPNVTVKVPLTPDGLKVCRASAFGGTMVNVTLCFSAAQALLAAKAGRASSRPSSAGSTTSARLAGAHSESSRSMGNIRHQDRGSRRLDPQPDALIETAKMGAHVATIPPAVLRQLFNHPLTDKGLAHFSRIGPKRVSRSWTRRRSKLTRGFQERT